MPRRTKRAAEAAPLMDLFFILRLRNQACGLVERIEEIPQRLLCAVHEQLGDMVYAHGEVDFFTHAGTNRRVAVRQKPLSVTPPRLERRTMRSTGQLWRSAAKLSRPLSLHCRSTWLVERLRGHWRLYNAPNLSLLSWRRANTTPL
jgi:hypothetical protein